MIEISELLSERQRRKEHYAKYKPGNIPGWDQERIHRSQAPILLIFGGNQSGKSLTSSKEIEWRIRGKHPYKTTTEPPVIAWVISTEYATIRNGIYRHLIEHIPPWEVEAYGPKVQGHDLHSYIKLKNGSKVEFYSAKGREEARQKLQAAKVHIMAIDEEVSKDVMEELTVRQLAASRPVMIISATLIMSEPWVLDLEERAERGDEEICLSRLRTDLNPNVDKATLNRVMTSMDSETISYRIYGKSRKHSGLVYKDFNQKHLTTPFHIPLEWPRYCALDPGIRTFAVLWMAVDPSGHKVLYDELYLHGIALHEVVELIRLREGWVHYGYVESSRGLKVKKWKPHPTKWTPIQLRVIDDKRGSRLITGDYGVLEQLSVLYNMYCVPAEKNKLVGIERCRQALTPMIDQRPETIVFNTLTNFISEIKQYRYRPDKSLIHQNEPAQEPIKKKDHLLDCWRYLNMLNPQYERVNVYGLFDEEEETEIIGDFSIREYRQKKQREKNRDRQGVHDVIGL